MAERFCRTVRVGSSPIVQLAALIWLTTGSTASAQGAPDRNRPFEISDNSFLVEEALNQEPGVFQNIFNLRVDGGGLWQATFTQEWPIVSRMHQLSYTVPYSNIGGSRGFGDAFVHYRIQAIDGEGAAPAFSPRVSVVVPSGNASRGLGNGNPGWQVNLPFSKQVQDVYFHWNAGFTHFPSAETDGGTFSLLAPHVAASGIWRVRPMVNLMLESTVEWVELVENSLPRRETWVTLLPGVRTGWNVGDTQTIVGLGIPLRFTDGTTHVGAFLYFSYELPFAHP